MSTVEDSAPPPLLLPPEKVAWVLVYSERDESEWYSFPVSDDSSHNQPPPPPPYPNFVHYLTPFHRDDDKFTDLKPKATAIESYASTSWAILPGNILYNIPTAPLGVVRIDRIDLSCSNRTAEWSRVRPMPNQVRSAFPVALGGRLYCLFCLGPGGGRPPWAAVYDPSMDEWESLPDPPNRPGGNAEYVFTAAIQVPKPCIVVGSWMDQLLQIYNVDEKYWELQKFEPGNNFVYGWSSGQTLAVDSTLYWYVPKKYCLSGCDLVTKKWSIGYFPMHDHLNEDEEDGEGIVPHHLAHLDGDKFCLFWVSVSGTGSFASPDSLKSRLHCMKLRVLSGNPCPNKGFVPLDISILSCESHVFSGNKEFCNAMVV